MLPENNYFYTCIYYIFSLNLYELIKKNNYQGFSLSLIRRFAHSLVQCLKLLHREGIIHCDLKPVSIIEYTVQASFITFLSSSLFVIKQGSIVVIRPKSLQFV
jgi:Serine/threonine protein kinase